MFLKRCRQKQLRFSQGCKAIPIFGRLRLQKCSGYEYYLRHRPPPIAHVRASSASAPAPAPDLSEICRLRLRLRIPGSSAYPRDRSSRHWPPSLDHQIKNPDINASHQERRRKQIKGIFSFKDKNSPRRRFTFPRTHAALLARVCA